MKFLIPQRIEHIIIIILFHVIYDNISSSGYTTADDKCLWVHHMGHVGQRYSQIFGKFIHDIKSVGISRLRLVKDILCRNLLQGRQR